MNTSSLILILVAVLLNTLAQLLLKAGTNAIGVLHWGGAGQLWANALRLGLQPQLLAGLACYVVSFGIWVAALFKVPVSIAYPLLSLGYLLNAAAAWYFLGESLQPAQLLGMALIVAGVFVMVR
ncbi:SMR family transporter [Melaminivora sp.]|uniref:DMT family transporter n=1 Tax=Melaminivora sp. TaxID=1933032 RepID=UPI0028A665FC|nr:SMR family transporter [Melaminivora sp.]